MCKYCHFTRRLIHLISL